MSLKPQSMRQVPEVTQQVAQAAFPKGNLCLTLRDQIGTLFQDQDFTNLFPSRGQPAQAPWCLALVTLLQFLENLSDRQAAEAVRSRIDWKYLLALELTDPGFDASVLCEFRARLIEHNATEQLLEIPLKHLREKGLLKPGGKQRTDSTHILASVRRLNRIELLGETIRYGLESLAQIAPSWLQTWMPQDWIDRYGGRVDSFRLPKDLNKQQVLLEQMVNDGFLLYEKAFAQALAELPPIAILRRIWLQQCQHDGEKQQLRPEADLAPGAVSIRSPFDIEARLSFKHGHYWTGYKVHWTETCDTDQIHLFTQVTTTQASCTDDSVTENIQKDLIDRNLRPDIHLVDEGYTEAALLASSMKRGITLLGPVALDPSRQAKSGRGFDVTKFEVDWQRECVRCPAGQESLPWRRIRNARGSYFFQVQFGASRCLRCSHFGECTTSRSKGRTLYLHERDAYEALHRRRQEQKTDAFRQAYARRSGIEGSLCEGIRVCGIRRSRYVGLAKTHLQHVASASALNLGRVVRWLWGQVHAPTRVSRLEIFRMSSPA